MNCLVETERNGYDDSDFFMTVWDDTINSPRCIMFATTRAGCGRAYNSYVDATDDVKEMYRLWKLEKEHSLIKENRRLKAIYLIKERAMLKALANKHGYSYAKFLKMRSTKHYDSLLELLSKNVRSSFKLSMRKQLIDWLNGKSTYESPFSYKQWNYL